MGYGLVGLGIDEKVDYVLEAMFACNETTVVDKRKKRRTGRLLGCWMTRVFCEPGARHTYVLLVQLKKGLSTSPRLC